MLLWYFSFATPALFDLIQINNYEAVNGEEGNLIEKGNVGAIENKIFASNYKQTEL